MQTRPGSVARWLQWGTESWAHGHFRTHVVGGWSIAQFAIEQEGSQGTDASKALTKSKGIAFHYSPFSCAITFGSSNSTFAPGDSNVVFVGSCAFVLVCSTASLPYPSGHCVPTTVSAEHPVVGNRGASTSSFASLCRTSRSWSWGSWLELPRPQRRTS